MENQLFEVPAIAMGVLQSKLNKLSKKAKKAGTSDIKLIRVGRRTEVDGTQVIIVAIEGDPVKYEGYTFLARLDHNLDPNGSSNIVYSMPGGTLTPEQRLAPANCDHCGWKRNRKDTFVLRKDVDGSFIQVGRTCLKDFFGHDPAEIVRRAQYITKVIDTVKDATLGGEAYMTDRRTVDLQTFLAYVISCIEVNGWTSGKEAWGNENKTSTRTQACNSMFRWPYPDPADRPTKEQIKTAEKVLEFVLTLDAKQSDFNFNITQMAKMEIIDYKMTGVAAAMVFCYNRSLEQEAAKATPPKDDLSCSQYVGTEKDRLTLDVKILSSKIHGGQFGSYYVTRMLDSSGNLYISFGSYHADVDSQTKVRGTVKRHQEFKGIKQTVLNRVTAVGAS